ncbi:MAG: pyrimidine dimer glycosylase [Pelosinus sp.]|jgi:uncharacterized protein (TIGR02328 family)|nr:pyrimidine dimer glycosylase [Pelosinus sp.]
MRLWHYQLIEYLPRQQLLGQHRECCALRGNGWGKKHAIVDYVFKHHPHILWNYHVRVMSEMKCRGYHVDKQWMDPCYRGKSCERYNLDRVSELYNYPEHNEGYLKECLINLAGKGIVINEMKSE